MQNRIMVKINNETLIDIKGLPQGEREALFEFIEFLKRRQEAKDRRKKLKPIQFKEWNLGSKGKLNRKEIYDYL